MSSMMNIKRKLPSNEHIRRISSEVLSQMLNYLLILFLGLAVGAVVIILSGKDPVAAYASLWRGAFGNWFKFADTLDRSAVLIFAGLAAAVAFRTSVFNLGLEGQLYMGAMAAAIVGFGVDGLPKIIHLPLCLLAGILAGALWTIPVSYLRLRWNVPVMVPSLMLNYIGILFTQYLVSFPFRDPEATMAGTPVLLDTARLPKFIQGAQINIGFILAIVMVFVIYWFLFKTKTGYELRIVGFNPNFASSAGMPVKRSALLAMLISGGLVGLGGATMITGFFGRFMSSFSVGYGWDGMMISLLAQNHPLGILPASLFYAALANGAMTMQSQTGVSQTVVGMVKGAIMFFVTAQVFIIYFKERMRKWKLTSAG
jgi:general nucleoside transport system permease protein